MIKTWLKKRVEPIIPTPFQLPIRYYWHFLRGTLDPEIKGVSHKLSGFNCFVDVGANAGLYTYHFSSQFNQVVAFEPLIERSKWIEGLKRRNITVYPVALSNQVSDLSIWIPLQNGTLFTELASVEGGDSSMVKRVIPARTLDSYQLSGVDLIKIDVEGHEYAVLEGGVDTIQRCQPVILVEIEQRHHRQPIRRVFDWLYHHGYTGYFLDKGAWVSIQQFHIDLHQTPYLDNVSHPLYVNNFLFMPVKRGSGHCVPTITTPP